MADLRIIDLFAGCGGITEGFVDVGFEPVFAVEWERHAAATYEVNFGHHVVCDDISNVSRLDLPAADVVVGGPPCQGFSQLGSRDPEDPRNHLWREYGKIVAWVKPQAFVLENVPQFIKSAQFDLLREWTQPGGILSDYRLAHGILNAADFGVPQNRKRAIVIGVAHADASLPTPTHGAGPGLARFETVRDAIGDIFNAFRHPGSSVLPDVNYRDGIPGPFKAGQLHLERHPTDLSRRRYDTVPAGGNRFDLPEDLMPACWANKPTGTTDVMGRLWWDRPSVTIRTEFYKPEKGRYLHPQYDPDDATNRVNRPITHWEAARLQTFPDSFAWCGTKIEIARQIGNAVPPRMASAIARHVGDLLGSL